jgi:hypothetical protein
MKLTKKTIKERWLKLKKEIIIYLTKNIENILRIYEDQENINH